MKIGDFGFVKTQNERDQLRGLIEAFNDNSSNYPRGKTVHSLFSEQAKIRPDAIALLQDGEQRTYRELDEYSNRIAQFLIGQNSILGQNSLIGQSSSEESFIAFILDDLFNILATILGALKAGRAYFPIDADTPCERIKYMLNDARSPVLFFEKKYLRHANRLQWDCPALNAIVCMDSDDINGEWESVGEFMKQDVWDYVGQTAFDDISGGGWKSSYTGEWLSREVMDEYGENIRVKLSPKLRPDMKVLEIGCSSGISMFRLAPLVKEYCGTDLSPSILQWTAQECQKRNAQNIRLHQMPAHEIHRLEEGGFDVVIINSVLQCFSGHNYLRHVLRMALDSMNDQGILFLGNVWDQDLKEEFTESLIHYQRNQAKVGERTIVDHSEALFINRDFLNDLRNEFPAIQSIETSPMIAKHESELSIYGYDAILHVDKKASHAPPSKTKFRFDRKNIAEYGTEAVPERGHPRGLAYIMYTSGTTGRPKGALIEHRSIVRMVKDANFISVNENDCILQTGALAFDASTFEFWASLLNGARLCRPQKHLILDAASLKEMIQRNGTTVMWLTSSLFNQLIESDVSIFDGMRAVLTGGEKLSPYHINMVRRQYSDLLLINGYGPTENTTFTTTFQIDECMDGDIPIGRPVSNTQVYILDGNLELAPVGVAGEIFAGGDGLARGYLNDAALTSEKFIAHPWRAGERIYRTGDLGRWRADGVVEYLGRIDDQVKIRGHRIEPREIEAVLRGVDRIKEAVVLAQNANTPNACLTAYITADDEYDAAPLRDSLKHTLPDYMIPAHFIRMDRLPLNANGKVDRAMLPEPQDDDWLPSRQREKPKGELEAQLCGIWKDVIGGKAPGVTDDFFESGGHSLTVSKLVSRIHQRMGVVVPLATIFERPTIRGLANSILENATFGIEIVDQPRVRLNRVDGPPNLFAFPPGTGDAAGFIQLAQQLNCAFYAFNFIESNDRLQRYVRLIKEIDPDGPYLLLGYSSGGNLAYHVAGELERADRTASDIVMVDSGRKLEPIRFDPNDIETVIREFIEHESNRPYVNSPILLEKARKLILDSYAYFERSTDQHSVNANIHLLRSDDSSDVFSDAFGRILSNKMGWKDVSRGAFLTHQGVGGHNHMLSSPFLEHNAALIQSIVQGIHHSKG